MARYDLADAGAPIGQVMARLTRTPAGWEMQAIGDRSLGLRFHKMLRAISTTP